MTNSNAVFATYLAQLQATKKINNSAITKAFVEKWLLQTPSVLAITDLELKKLQANLSAEISDYANVFMKRSMVSKDETFTKFIASAATSKTTEIPIQRPVIDQYHGEY